MPSSNITIAQIKTLRAEAVQAGDAAQISVCEKALRNVRWAVVECQRVIEYARNEAAA